MTEKWGVLTSAEIQQIIPQRPPILLVDRILDLIPGKRIVGIKNVSINEPYFQGHFPNDPVMPGSMVLESVTQVASVLICSSPEYFGRNPKVAAIHKFQLRRNIVPGDQCRIELDFIKAKGAYVKLGGLVLVDGKRAAEIEILFETEAPLTRPRIHPTAQIHSTAIIGKDVSIGPYTTVGEDVIIGDRTVLADHVMIERWTKIGSDCNIHFGAVIGSAAQDIKYAGERSWVEIGDHNDIREYVTINRATGRDAITKIGSHNKFFTSVHIGHNCQIGNFIIMANAVHLSGHTVVDDNVNIGGMTGIHQFVRIGTGAMIGGFSRIAQDIPPYTLCEGNPACIRGLNVVGLKRHGADRTLLSELKEVYRLYFRSSLNTTQALEEIAKLPISSHQAKALATFLAANSKRGINKKSATVHETAG